MPSFMWSLLRPRQSPLTTCLPYMNPQCGPILGIAAQPSLPYDKAQYVFRAVIGTTLGDSVSGIGSDPHIEVAMAKAIAEGLERYCVDKSSEGTSTNGVAAHHDAEEAAQLGVFEAIERDAFLVHWLANLAPIPLQAMTLRNTHQRRIVERLLHDDHEVWLLALALDISVPTFAVITIPPNGRPCLGLGCALDADRAVAKALTESLRHVGASVQWAPITPTAALARVDHGVLQGHRDFHWSEKGMSLRKQWLSQSASPKPYTEYLSQRHWFATYDAVLTNLKEHHGIVMHKSLDTSFIDHKWHVVQSHVPMLQNLFVGRPQPALINHSRFQQLGLQCCTALPHPLD